MSKPIRRSPLKARPLRLPGQSVEERRQDIIFDQLLLPVMLAVILLTLAGLEWLRYLRPSAPSPTVLSAFALVALVYAAFRIRRAVPELRSLQLARDGERAVGQYLDALREQGYRVFHDIGGEGFNLDHVLVGPAGVLTIETKTWSKGPVPAKVFFDGEKLLVNGFEADRDPVVQAKAQASWLRALVAESAGRKIAVRPVILFPGWYVESTEGAYREVWVLNPKALPKFLANEKRLLADEDIKLISFHLSRFIRGSE